MQQEPLPQEQGQPSLPLDPLSPSTTLRARIRGLGGLAQKPLPDRAGAHLKPLSYWSSYMPRSGERSAEHAPALYVDRGSSESPNPEMRLLAPFGKQAARARQCRERFVLSSKCLGLQGEGAPDTQQVLRPRALYTLSHLVSGLRHPVPGVELYPVGVRNGQPMVLVEPSPMLSRLGYAVCGDNYRALEQDYAELASCMVQFQTWDDDRACWAMRYEEPLIDHFDTGRRLFTHGREVDVTSRGSGRRRYRNWQLGLSRPLLEMLKCRSSEFAGLSPELWRAAGQSAPAQWLVCYLCGHGYDAGDFLPHRLDTLAYRMRACSDQMLHELSDDSLEVADFLAGNHGAPTPRRATPAQFQRVAAERSRSYGDAEAAFVEKKRSIRESIRHVFRGINRLAKNNVFSRVGLVASNGDQDVARGVTAPGAFRRVSHQDRLTLRRWPALIERHILTIPDWVFATHQPLLEAAGKAVGSVSREFPSAKGHLDWMLRRLNGARKGSGIARFLLSRMAWLAGSVGGHVSAVVFQHPGGCHSATPRPGLLAL